jgi:hypothetical protein
MNINHLATIIQTCNDIADHKARPINLAFALEMDSHDLEKILCWNHVIDINCEPVNGVTGQDILNVVMLWYSMRRYHFWTEHGFVRKGSRYTPTSDPIELVKDGARPP